ncbi:MAG: hypothetical protein ICV84_10665 [Flavisolibacter sp.]|nr:hypothetical protein [Flavisolibacter sp.]
MDKKALFHFYGSLQDFLPKVRKGLAIPYTFTGTPAVKDAIEAIGVPHVEVEAIRVEEKWIGFYDKLQEHDQVHVYPSDASLTLPAFYSLRPDIQEPVSFILDVHLGSLARLLRLLGFDTAYHQSYNDSIIAKRAAEEHRIVLTRDIGLLKHRSIQWGYWLRSQHAEEQIFETIKRYHLQQKFRPFSRCLVCNHPIVPVLKEAVAEKIPHNALLYFDSFYQCTNCKKVYWKGSHYERMMDTVDRIKVAFE